MLILKNISYTHANKNLLFENIQLAVNTKEKIALIGANGSGKSTLLKLIAKELSPLSGQISSTIDPYYIPQLFGQYNHLTIAQALGAETKMNALHNLLNGNTGEENYTALADDWTIEDRCKEALSHWQLNDLELSQKLENLSGGQKTKVFLAGISIHRPEFILLDEPSNHLDLDSRELLYDFIRTTKSTLLLVSHDRKLLDLVDKVCELTKHGIKVYGGNYEFYSEQKQIEQSALNLDLQNKARALRKAKEMERETLERQNKLNSRGKDKQEKAGVARIMMNTFRNNAEKSTSKLKAVHSEKINSIANELQELRSALPDNDKMKFGFDDSHLHSGKILMEAKDINYAYDTLLWKENLNFQITSGERLAIKGKNGSGKTTLIKLILGRLEPQRGKLYRAEHKSVYIDQEYSLIDNLLSVYEQAQSFNSTALQEHEVKIRLDGFLFHKEAWDKKCSALSGGEKMRLLLCCLTISNKAPDIILLDEPTNNLDLQNLDILTNALIDYRGTLIVVSHDAYFLKQLNIEKEIQV